MGCEGLDEIPEDCQERWFAGFGATTLDARELPESESGGDDAGSEEQELEVGVELASPSAQGSGAGGSSSSSEDEETKRQRVTSSEEEDDAAIMSALAGSSNVGDSTEVDVAASAASASTTLELQRARVQDYSDI